VPLNSKCHLICVTGGKGGVGKSVFAANLAAAFLKEMKAPTLLIDMDPKSCGDQNIITGLRPIKTLNEIANMQIAINPNSLKTIITPHPTGLHFIGAVSTPDMAPEIPGEVFRKQLHVISQFYGYIVVDLGSEIHPNHFGFIEDASSLLMLTTPEVLTVNQTRKALNDLMAATVPADLIQIVINKMNKTSLSPQAIQQTLRRQVIGAIPQDDVLTFQSLQTSTLFVASQSNAPITAAYHGVVRALTGGILQRLKELARPKMETVNQGASTASNQIGGQVAPSSKLDPLTQLKLTIHSELIKEMDLKKDLMNTKGDANKEKVLENKTRQVISQLTDKLGQGLSREERARIITEVLDESLGLGPLEKLLGDSKVTEIMVNGANKIYVEREGKLTLSQVTFTSNLQLRNVIERIVTPLGRRIDEKTPYVDARLADGSRVNAVIEPLSIDGPALTIRKFPEDRITINDYVDRFGSMTRPMADFIRICVEQGLNIIISGGTGTGKTTLLNVMSGFIPSNERIITVEDAAELQLKQEHVVRLETRPANMEGSGEVSIRDLIRNSLRMRPDRIVVGECRDGAALDMLSAMNTGHDGSMTTVHANTPREAISRLETLCLMAGMELPAKAIREQIAGAVNLIVQISRLSDGSRKIKSITEVVGIQGETVTLQEIFRFKEEGFDKNRKIIGQFQAMGLIPTFIEKFEQRGIQIPRNLFTTNTSTDAQKPSSSSGTPSSSGATSASAPKRPQLARPIIKKASGGEET
jgi:septum site-determining protein MinD